MNCFCSKGLHIVHEDSSDFSLMSGFYKKLACVSKYKGSNENLADVDHSTDTLYPGAPFIDID